MDKFFTDTKKQEILAMIEHDMYVDLKDTGLDVHSEGLNIVRRLILTAMSTLIEELHHHTELDDILLD
jgi:hypothetical protein